MPIPTRLPRGCAAARGASDIPHMSTTGGHAGQQANRLYMLHARRESLVNKRDAMKARLKEVLGQLKGLEADLRRTQTSYNKLVRRNRKGNGRGDRAAETNPGKGMTIEF